MDNSYTHHTYAWTLYCNCLYNWLTCTHRCNDMHPNHVFVEHVTSKAAMGLDSDSEWMFIVALDDEEVKTPASMACSHSKECYCCELPEAIFVSE